MSGRGRRRQRTRWQRRWNVRTALGVAAVAGVLIAAGAVGAWLTLGGSDGEPGPPTAAIVDQLSLTFPNEAFAGETTATLEGAGYEVDYYPGEDVTVEFYRELPYFGYDLIIFRSHADRLQATAIDGTEVNEVVLFTSEPYSTERYQNDQAKNNLVIARYSRDGDPYFGVAAGFIRDGGADYDGATIIMMGCEGLLSDRTAQAFVERGADVYISWDETVSVTHTDAATSRLLQHLLVDELPAGEAVARTMADVGPDPSYGSSLAFYPPEG